MTYAELRTKPRILCSLTGLRIQEFEALLPSFAAAWDAFTQETFRRKGRKRAIGAGRKAHLSVLEDKLLFILVYFRLYPTQDVQGFLFGISQAQANEWIHQVASGREYSCIGQTPGCPCESAATADFANTD